LFNGQEAVCRHTSNFPVFLCEIAMTRIKRGKRMNQVKPGRPIAKEQE